MKKNLFFSAMACIAISTTSIYAQDTIPAIVGDSAQFSNSVRVGDRMIVEGETKMQENATASRDFTVDGNAYFKGYIYYSGAPEVTGDFENKNILFYDPASGLIEKSGLVQLGQQIYSKGCNPVGGIVESPVWNNGPNKIFVPCPEVKVGVGTTDPLYSLDTRGTGYFQTGVRIGNITASSFSSPALLEAERSSTYMNPLIRFSEKDSGGNVHTLFKVEKDGMLYCTGVKVRPTAMIPDYVFKPGYELMPLSEVKKYVDTHQHLPNIPSEEEIKRDGMSLDEMQLKLLEKVEELTLYVLELDARNAELEKEIEALKAEK